MKNQIVLISYLFTTATSENGLFQGIECAEQLLLIQFEHLKLVQISILNRNFEFDTMLGVILVAYSALLIMNKEYFKRFMDIFSRTYQLLRTM